jgi:integrase
MRANLKLAKPETERVLQRVDANPRRLTDKDYGRADRKYLRPSEVATLIRGAKAGRHGVRDGLMISIAYHHAMRVTELVGLTWDAIDLKAGTIKVRRKGGIGGVQHLSQSDARPLRALKFKADVSPFVFVSERGGLQLTRDAFAKMLAAAGARAGARSPAVPPSCATAWCGTRAGKQRAGERVSAPDRDGPQGCAQHQDLRSGCYRLD